jgi:hypothetical protein
MDVIKQTESYRLGWYDDARSILVIEFSPKWTWAEAVEGFQLENDIIAQSHQDIYAVVHVPGNVSLAGIRLKPKTGRLNPDFTHNRDEITVRKLLGVDHPNEKLLVFASAHPFLRTVINFSGRYGVGVPFSKYRFVTSLPDAIGMIEAYKASEGLRATGD